MIWEMKLSTTYFFYLIESLQHTNQSKGLLKELDEPFSIKYTMGNKKKKKPHSSSSKLIWLSLHNRSFLTSYCYVITFGHAMLKTHN